MKLHYPHFDNKYQHHEHKYFRGFRVELKLLVGEKLKVWNARRHRKGFNLIGNEHHETANPLVLLNLPIAILFIVGSAHFIFASLLQLEWLSFKHILILIQSSFMARYFSPQPHTSNICKP